MLFLRIMTLPIAMAAFATLYVVAIKAPTAVEVGSLLIWPTLALLLIGEGIRKAVCR
ncbi:hypothetical protein AB3G45_22415 [Shinella sp. S4-D37]|uniref:hypothetical protein n=1 Tax=Shinella sp. S4-D37 TaxID=3161999 RepID=UPI003467837F